MVRELKVDLAYRKDQARTKELSIEETQATSLMVAEQVKAGQPSISSLSHVAVPFWIVQTSPSSSILLGPSRTASIEFKFTENKHVSDMRRILRSEVSEPKDVPRAVDQIIEILRKTNIYSKRLSYLLDPSPLLSVSDYVRPADAESESQEIETAVSSQEALSTSEEYQEARDTVRLRLNEMEELRSLVGEKLGGHLSVAENIILTEERRYRQQLDSMEQKLKENIDALKAKRDDALYTLREKHKMNLRALTAEFTRSSSQIETLFGEMLQKTKDFRTRMGEKGENVNECMDVFKELVSHLRNRSSGLPEILSSLEAESEKILNSVGNLENQYEQEKSGVESHFLEETEAKKKQLEDFKEEMQNNLDNFVITRDGVKQAIERLNSALNERIMDIQKEFLDLTRISVSNQDIPGLAPLTRITVHCAIVVLPNGRKEIVTPYVVPDERTGPTLRHQPISRVFHEDLTSKIEEWTKQDTVFSDAYERSVRTGNIFIQGAADALVKEGIGKLQRSQRLNDGTKEQIETIWNRYSGKCPECGVKLAGSVEFCSSCGVSLLSK